MQSPDDTQPIPDSMPSTPQRTTGGNTRWQPPSAEELQAQMPGYTIGKLIGRGGMGAVYKGVQTNLDRPVAIKILPPGVEREDPSFAERFKSEARLMARLNHPAVVSVFDFGTTSAGQLYFAMEYVDGSDVAQMISSQGRLPPEHALAITAHVCDALAAAHQLGIVHRDIKPANVLINMQGQVKVADFGLAKVEEPGQHGLTKTGYAMGTPDFVAPEALMLGTSVDGRADLYAVGVMLYQMLTGEVPRGAFKPATARLPGLDPRFDPIIMKAMQTDREERYQSSAELRRDLDVILTVPLVQQDRPVTAAIPAAQVAHVPAQRSAAQKPAYSQPPPRRAPLQVDAGAYAPLPEPKSKAPLMIGLSAATCAALGYFLLRDAGSPKASPEVVKTSQQSPTLPPPPSVTASQSPKPEPAKAPPVVTTKVPEPPRPAPVTPTATQAPTPKPETTAEPKAVMATPSTVPSPSPPVSASSSPTPSALDQRLAALDSGFQAAVERDANTAFKTSIAALDKLYLTALDRALATASKGGKLEEALALREEKQRIEKGQGVPSEVDESTLAPGKVPDTLKTLRQTYRSTTAQHEATKAKAIQPLYDKYDQALAAVQTELTQAQKLDDAMRVKTVREQIAATRGGGLPTPSVPGLAATPPDSAPKASSSGQPTLDPFDPLLDYSRLPRWHQDAMKEGGKLRVWGYWDGQKIEERSLLRPFSESDYTRVVADTGDPGVLLGVRKRGAGKRILLENPATPAAEYKKVQAIESHNKWWLADNFLHRHQRRGSELELDEGALLSGIGDAHFIQRKNREWTAGGSHWTNNANDNQIESALNPLLTALKKGEITLITATANDVFWITKDNKYREFFVNLRPGSVKEAATTTNPSEPMVKLIHGGGKYGWLTLGKSGAVYARNPNAFSKPLDDLPPALTLKNSGDQIAIRKTDGNWHGIGPDAEMNEVISQAGSAIDLDVSVYEGKKRKMVVWIEPKSTLRPPNAPTSTTKPATPTPAPPAAPPPAQATAAKSDFTNSLGMKFVKVPGTKVLFCIHETRYSDYAAYDAETPGLDRLWKDQTIRGVTLKDRTEDHPAKSVSWEDAKGFCDWLSKKESKIYRLPTDEEWSYAAGIGRDEKRKKGDTPGTLASVPNEYPWGTNWPPPKGSGNYGDESYNAAVGAPKVLTGYDDGYPTTAPVMSFKPNRHGLYDMAGNLQEWCEDWFDNTQQSHVFRSSSWMNGGNNWELLSSYRDRGGVNVHESKYGFRIVLETTE